MSNRNVCIIVEAANVEAARALAVSFGDGSGTFSAAMCPVGSGITDRANATHYGYSGEMISDEFVAAFESSVSPMFNVSRLDGTDFFTIVGSRNPPLQIVPEQV